jgi:hypothetical protein
VVLQRLPASAHLGSPAIGGAGRRFPRMGERAAHTWAGRDCGSAGGDASGGCKAFQRCYFAVT